MSGITANLDITLPKAASGNNPSRVRVCVRGFVASCGKTR